MSNSSNPSVPEPHAIQRARERLGKHFDEADLKEISALISSGKAVLMGSCSRRGTQCHLVKYDEATFKVIFDPRTETVVTFYGPNFRMSKGGYRRKASGKPKRKQKYRGKMKK